MKLFKYIEEGKKIEEYNATLSDEGTKKVFKKLKKYTLTENMNVVIRDNTEESIEDAMEKLQYFNPLNITFYPESIRLEKIPYSRRAGLDRVGKYHTHYVIDLSIEKLPFLYHVLFDDMRGMEERRTEIIFNYLMNKPSDYIIKLMKKYGKEEVIFDSHISEEDKISIIKCFFNNLTMQYVGVKDNVDNNLNKDDDYAHAYERITEKIEYNEVVNKNKKKELK